MDLAALILDLDGTLYPQSNPLTGQIDSLTAQLFDGYVADNPGGLQELEQRFPCVLDGLREANIERGLFYRTVYDRIAYEGCLSPDLALRHALQALSMPVFVVSLSPVRHIRRVLQELAIDEAFASVFSLEDVPVNSKGPVYGEIIASLGVAAQAVLVAGDNYETDLAPAAALGCRVVQIGPAGMRDDSVIVVRIHELLQMITGS